MIWSFFFLKMLFIYLFKRETVRESMREGKVRGRSRLPKELGARCGT